MFTELQRERIANNLNEISELADHEICITWHGDTWYFLEFNALGKTAILYSASDSNYVLDAAPITDEEFSYILTQVMTTVDLYALVDEACEH